MFRLTVNIGGAFDLYVSPAASDELRNAAPDPYNSEPRSSRERVNVDLLRYEETADYGRSRCLLLLTERKVDTERREGLKAKLELELSVAFDRVMRARNKDEVDDETARIYRACKSLDSWISMRDDGGKIAAESRVALDATNFRKEIEHPSRKSEEAPTGSYPDAASSARPKPYILVCFIAVLILSAMFLGWAYVHHSGEAHLSKFDQIREELVALSNEFDVTRNEMSGRLSDLEEDVKNLKNMIANLAPRPFAVPPLQEPFATVEEPLELSKPDRVDIQNGLQRLQHYSGPLDGVFGPGTRRAIESYQQDQGEPVTGILTDHQARHLLQVGTDE